MNKKLFLGSLLMLALCVTGCQTVPSSEKSADQSDTSASTTSDSNQSGGSSESSDTIPAPAAGVFAFNDTQLNTAQEIHTENQLKYLNMQKEYYSMGASDLNACDAMGNKNVSSPLPIKLDWNFTPEAGKTVSKYAVVFGQKADLSDGFEVVGTSKPTLNIYNTFLGTNYFKVVAKYADGSEKASDIKTFKVTEQAPRSLLVGNMPNCRDMGGRTTYAGGKIKQGLIYRTSGSRFDNSTPSDQDAKDVLTKQLKVKTEINVANSTSNNVSLSGVKVENCYMAYGSVPYSNLARNSVRIRQVMDVLAEESNYPVFYHCRIGTDRTGITGVMIGGLLGIKFNEIIQDYGYSNFAPIDNQRYPGKTPDNNGDDIKKYIDEILALPGENFQEQTYLALRMLGVPAAKLDKIINFMTEGTKATIPATARVGEGDDLTSTVTKTTSSDYKAPASYYALGSNASVSYATTTTGGKKDIIVYLGYTGNVSTSTSTKLANSLTLKIDGTEQTISNTKNLWQAGFGSTQQDSRKGYMFNILGSYDFTAGQHTVEIVSKSNTFNIATVTIADRGAATGGDQGQGGQGQGGEQQHEHAFVYGDDVVASNKTTYKIGTCSCGKKAVKWAVNAKVAGTPNKRPFKFASNDDSATYTFDYTGTLAGKLYMLVGVDHYADGTNDNKQYGYFYNGNPNLEFEINGTVATITNAKSYEECGVQNGGDTDESKAALMEVCAATLNNGSNTIKVTRKASRSATIWDLVVVEQ